MVIPTAKSVHPTQEYAATQPQSEAVHEAPEEESKDIDLVGMCTDAARRCLKMAEQLGAEGGQHAIAAAELLASAVKRDTTVSKDELFGFGEKLGEAATAALAKYSHTKQQDAKAAEKREVEAAPQVPPSPEQVRYMRYRELTIKLETMPASDPDRAAVQSEVDSIEVEFELEAVERERDSFQYQAFGKVRERMIEDLATRVMIAASPTEAVSAFKEQIALRIETLDAMRKQLPKRPGYQFA